VTAAVSHEHYRMLRKLDTESRLTAEEKTAICALPLKTRPFEKRVDLVEQGDRPHHACLIAEGIVCRYKCLSDGRRQILSVHVPGDLPDLQSLFLDRMDHGLATLTKGRAAFIPHAALRRLIEAWPNVAAALWRDTLVDASIFRDGMAGLGRRTARERVAHLICEMAVRLKVLDLVEGTQFILPLTQTELADALGVSNVHINRVLKSLRADGLIRSRGRQVEIVDWPALCAAGDFDLDYLHLRPDAVPDDLKPPPDKAAPGPA
jgi:CRP-like cAMP-binding protein